MKTSGNSAVTKFVVKLPLWIHSVMGHFGKMTENLGHPTSPLFHGLIGSSAKPTGHDCSCVCTYANIDPN